MKKKITPSERGEQAGAEQCCFFPPPSPGLPLKNGVTGREPNSITLSYSIYTPEGKGLRVRHVVAVVRGFRLEPRNSGSHLFGLMEAELGARR